MIIGVAHDFFYPITETYQLIAFSAFLYGFLCAKGRFRNSQLFYLLLTFVFLWTFLIHPVFIFTVTFVVVLAFLQKKITKFELLFFILFEIGFLIIKILFTPANSYDSHQYDNLLSFFAAPRNFFGIYSFRYLISHLFSTYLSVLLLIIIVWTFYRKYWELIFTSLFSLSFLFVSIITFNHGDSDIMIEKVFAPAIFMFVLIFSILYYNRKNQIYFFIVTLILVSISFFNIIKVGKTFTGRVHLLSTILDKMDSTTPKVIVNFSDFDEHLSRFNHWSSSLDALLLSKCKSDTPKTIFFTENKLSFVSDTNKPDLFLYLPWKPYAVKKLNTFYFNFRNIPYKIFPFNDSNIKIGHLKAFNGKYVCADENLKDLVFANKDSAKQWETFTLIIDKKNKCFIKSFKNNYWCSELNYGNVISANQKKWVNGKVF